MHSGRLKHRVAIQQPTTVNTKGSITYTWSTFKILGALIQPLLGRERWQSQMVQAEVTHKIVTRYIAGVNTSMRVVWGSRVFNIVSVINFCERNQWLEFLAIEEV